MNVVVRLPVIEDGLPTRPKTRADCADVPRPCPYISCRHHLFLDVSFKKLVFNSNAEDPTEMPADASCSLDIADRGVHTFPEMAELFRGGVTRQAIQFIERDAVTKLRANKKVLALVAETGLVWSKQETSAPSDDVDAEGGDHSGSGAPAREKDTRGARWRDAARNAYERRLVARGLASWRTERGGSDDGSTREDRQAEASVDPWGVIDQREVETWLAGESLDADGKRIEWPARMAACFDSPEEA